MVTQILMRDTGKVGIFFYGLKIPDIIRSGIWFSMETFEKGIN
jgi:hypothetical protein